MPSVHNMEYDLDCWRVKVKNSMKTMVKNTEWRNWEKGELRQMNTNIITQKNTKLRTKCTWKVLFGTSQMTTVSSLTH